MSSRTITNDNIIEDGEITVFDSNCNVLLYTDTLNNQLVLGNVICDDIQAEDLSAETIQVDDIKAEQIDAGTTTTDYLVVNNVAIIDDLIVNGTITGSLSSSNILDLINIIDTTNLQIVNNKIDTKDTMTIPTITTTTINPTVDTIELKGSLTIQDNLIVNGSTVSLNTGTVYLEDAIVEINSGNEYDISASGIISKYVSGTTKFAGLVRNPATGFSLYEDYYGDILGDLSTATLKASSSTISPYLAVSSSSSTIAGLVFAQSRYDQSNCSSIIKFKDYAQDETHYMAFVYGGTADPTLDGINYTIENASLNLIFHDSGAPTTTTPTRIFTAYRNNTLLKLWGDLQCAADSTQTIGSNGIRWLNIYTDQINGTTTTDYLNSTITNQELKTTSSPTFTGLTTTNLTTTNLTLNGTAITNGNIQYWNALNQQLTTTSSPSFTTATITNILTTNLKINDILVANDKIQYWNAINQALYIGANPSFAGITVTNLATISSMRLNDTAIENSKIQYWNALNQQLTTSSAPQFSSITVGNINGSSLPVDFKNPYVLTTNEQNQISAINDYVIPWNYLSVINQNLVTTSSPTFAKVYTPHLEATDTTMVLTADLNVSLYLALYDDEKKEWGTPVSRHIFAYDSVGLSGTVYILNDLKLNGTAIDNNKIQYWNALNQQLTTTSNPTFNNLTLNGNAVLKGWTQARDIYCETKDLYTIGQSTKKFNNMYVNNINGYTTPNQALTTTSSPTFVDLTVDSIWAQSMILSADATNISGLTFDYVKHGPSDCSSRIRFKDYSTQEQSGVSFVYAGQDNPTIGSTTYAVGNNTFNIVREEGGTTYNLMTFYRSSNNVNVVNDLLIGSPPYTTSYNALWLANTSGDQNINLRIDPYINDCSFTWQNRGGGTATNYGSFSFTTNKLTDATYNTLLKMTIDEITPYKSIIPTTDSTLDLGSSSKYYANAYVDNITCSNNIIPTTDSTSDLGSTSKYFANLYADVVNTTSIKASSTVYLDGASSGISFRNSTYAGGSLTYYNITQNYVNKSLFVPFTDLRDYNTDGTQSLDADNYYYGLKFPLDRWASGNITLPKDIKKSVHLYVKVHWMHKSIGSAYYVKWGITYKTATAGSTFSGATQTTGLLAVNTASKYYTVVMDSYINTSALDDNTAITFRIFRTPSGITDNDDGDYRPILLGVSFDYFTDKPGSEY